MTRILNTQSAHSEPLFYHPGCFAALRSVIELIDNDMPSSIDATTQRLPDYFEYCCLSQWALAQLQSMNWEKALAHCMRQSSDTTAFRRHFHQWFDGFRTLKFIHGLRSRGLANVSYDELKKLNPTFWPGPLPQKANAQQINRQMTADWGWQ